MPNGALLDFRRERTDQWMCAEAARHEVRGDHERQKTTVGFPAERGANHRVRVEPGQNGTADLSVRRKVVRAAFDFARASAKAEHA